MKWEDVVRPHGIKRSGLTWYKKGREYRDDSYDHRYISERLPGGRRLIMFFYKGKPQRYEIELHVFYGDGDSECYADIGVCRTFNQAAQIAAEWFALKRLKGEL